MKRYEVKILLTKSQLNKLKKEKSVTLKPDMVETQGKGIFDFFKSIF